MCLSGRKALRNYSLEEAAQYFRQALSLDENAAVATHGCNIPTAIVGLLEALYLNGDVLGTKHVAERYLPRLEKAGPSPELVFSLYFLSLMLANLCMFPQGEAKARQAFAVSHLISDVKVAAYARSCLFFLETVLGEIPLEDMERAAKTLIHDCENANDNYILNWAYWSLSYDYMHRGLDLEARRWVAKLIETGKARDDKRALGMGYWLLGWIEIIAQNYEEAERNAAAALATAVAPFDRNAARQVRAAAMLLQGRYSEGLPLMRKVHQWAHENGWLYSASGTNLSMATALALSGDIKTTIRLLKKGIKDAAANSSRVIASWNRILLAEIYLAMLIGDGPEASFSVIVRNIAPILGAKLFGARRVRELLLEARSNPFFAEHGTVRARNRIRSRQTELLRKAF